MPVALTSCEEDAVAVLNPIELVFCQYIVVPPVAVSVVLVQYVPAVFTAVTAPATEPGAKRKVSPVAGASVVDVLILSVFMVPATVDAQGAVFRLLKLALLAPLKPTCTDPAVAVMLLVP